LYHLHANKFYRPAGYISTKEGSQMQKKLWTETVDMLDLVKEGISENI
jgi:hypothetical protein